ncbi:MAG: response regulator [Archangiaceae bacterium]|nr:response regulator [Archangiaceae bacterium]
MARILAIDDSPSIRALVSTALGTDGHAVTSACDGAEALTLVSSQAFDLVITDFNMPQMNGLEFIKRYREKQKFTPVLVLTTEVNPTLRQSAKAAGATGWLVKPFQAEALRTLVKNLLA